MTVSPTARRGRRPADRPDGDGERRDGQPAAEDRPAAVQAAAGLDPVLSCDARLATLSFTVLGALTLRLMCVFSFAAAALRQDRRALRGRHVDRQVGHSAAPPSPFSRCFNTDGEGVSAN